MTTSKELAMMMHGSDIRDCPSKEHKRLAKESGLLIVYGASDDLMEFDGVFSEELGAPCTALVHKRGALADSHDDCECKFCAFEAMRNKFAKITSHWCNGEIAWTFSAEVAVFDEFDVVEDGEVYCRGLVIDVAELPDVTSGGLVDDARWR
jgi:hypothetical protein